MHPAISQKLPRNCSGNPEKNRASLQILNPIEHQSDANKRARSTKAYPEPAKPKGSNANVRVPDTTGHAKGSHVLAPTGQSCWAAQREPIEY